MNRVALLLPFLAFSSGSPPAFARTYYIDCSAGSDGASGTSPAAAWRTLGKVAATTFSPGDSILFKRGTRCLGQLWPKGSGDAERPIRIAAYGRGALPVVDAGSADAAIKLIDQQHWAIETLETAGGDPYGVFVSGTQGELRGFVLRNLVVHDVGGEAKSKVSGLVVVTASGNARMSDVLIDGITAYNTNQWAGIIVNGASREHRVGNVTIRNSIVHDVYGDGIILFSGEDGLIERSAAWRTGLSPDARVGTPNAIWTWTCRRCTVRQTEGFFIDSPGVDGGVYDIDWGNDDNIVEDNYGHDAMGYCAAVFGAEKQITTNSIIRGNLCIDNGRSPKLARRQGDLFITTWADGALDGVRIENNTFYWQPFIDVPAVFIDHADFVGARPNAFAGNRIFTGVSAPIRASGPLKLEHNIVESVPRAPAPSAQLGRFRLVLTGADRAQVVFLQAALAQYPRRLDALLIVRDPAPELSYDWNLGRVRLSGGTGRPGLQLLAPDGTALARWSGFASPVELGLALRRHLGMPEPFGAQARE
jgi:hypothetical protein